MREQIELLEHHADLLAQRPERRAVRAVAGILVAFGGKRAVDPDRPALMDSSAARQRSSVLLPEPLGPITTNT
jgi:hypothetical protein